MAAAPLEVYASVIVPTYNGGSKIGRCLASLRNQDCSRSFEVIVVMDGSTDNTVEVLKQFPEVRVLIQANAGPAAARNLGAREALGDIIVFTDDDCEPMLNWLTQMLKPFADPDAVGAKGVYRSRQPEIIARFVQIEYEDRYRLMARHSTIDFIDTYSAAFRRKRFLELNGYDTSFPVACAEDVELSYRMSAIGWKMVFVPTAVVYHQHPNAFMGYVRRKFKFAFWRVMAVKKNPEKMLRDSHTPQLMKLQMLFAPALPVGLLCDFLRPESAPFCRIVMLLFLLTALPFSLCAFSKDPLVGALAPGYSGCAFVFPVSRCNFRWRVRVRLLSN